MADTRIQNELGGEGEPAAIPFERLPLEKDGAPLNAWGRFGPDDELGTLNLLTPARVAAAARLIQTGTRIPLSLPLHLPDPPFFSRGAFTHTLLPKSPRAVNDDALAFNTQCSSQWDGLRHFADQRTRLFYNRVPQAALAAPDSKTLGIHNMVAAGGITGRAVLLDIARHAPTLGFDITPLETQDLPLHLLLSTAAHQRVRFAPGDILLVRVGFTAAYTSLSRAGRTALAARPAACFAGLEASAEMKRWLWERQFAAVGGDAVGFERTPVSGPGAAEELLHEVLLAGWGCPIGEMLDLERVARECETLGRWEFFVCSVPLNVEGGVASPVAGVAIF